MKKKPMKNTKGIFTKGMTWRIVYQGVMIGLLTLSAFVLGLATTTEAMEGLTLAETKIEVGQTMAFITLALSELVHVFNVRNAKDSILKSNPFNNRTLLLAIFASAALMFIVTLVPALRGVFGIVALPMANIGETALLIFAPFVIVEIMKLLKLNTAKNENE